MKKRYYFLYKQGFNKNMGERGKGVVTVIFLCIKRNIYNHVDDVSFLGWV